MELKDYLAKAMDFDATEILFAPNEYPRYRTENEWCRLQLEEGIQPLSPAVTRHWALLLCGEEAKQSLLEKGFASGFWETTTQKLFFEVHSSLHGFLVHLQWIPSEWRSADFWNFPKWTTESMAKGRGLHLVVSSDRRVAEAGTEALLNTVSNNSKTWIVWVKDEGLTQIQSESSLITYHRNIPLSCDIVVLEGLSQVLTAVEEAERGRGVILNLRHHSMIQGIRQITNQLGAQRFASQLKLALGLRTIHSASGWLPAFELLANTTSVEECLLKNDLSALEVHMKDSDRETGMRTLNQSLLQLMMKRKIDFKKGFELSPAPMELDALLKKVGI